ncbi:hypothetical protein TNCV_760851 [Trichonephila clavipes]|nr:hypothetical protein TNCV_760851 [Trichonephila clavipes]
MFSTPKFTVKCRQRDAQKWTLDVKAKLYKTHVDCLPENSSSRHTSKCLFKSSAPHRLWTLLLQSDRAACNSP